MRRGKDISKNYFEADKAARFDYLYDHYGAKDAILRCKRNLIMYFIEAELINSYWDEYCNQFFNKDRTITASRIMQYIEEGKTIDFLPNALMFSEEAKQRYRNYCLMKLEFGGFEDVLESMGSEDGKLIRRYITEEISLWDIADERKISYETAKGKIRDLKKAFKERTVALFAR